MCVNVFCSQTEESSLFIVIYTSMFQRIHISNTLELAFTLMGHLESLAYLTCMCEQDSSGEIEFPDLFLVRWQHSQRDSLTFREIC